MEPYRNTALVFGDLKDALLHYEYVIPMNFTGQFMGLRPSTAGSIKLIEKFKDPGMGDYHEIGEAFGEPDKLSSLYPPQLATHPIFKDVVNMFDGLLFSYMVKTAYGDAAFDSYLKNLSDVIGSNPPTNNDALCPTPDGLRQFFSRLVTDFKLIEATVDCSGFKLGSVQESPPTNALIAQRVLMIDTKKVEFSQIMEFRKDPKIMKKMRNFRLFAYECYEGKEKAFIEDDIQKRYDDYLEAVRISGFETTTKLLSSLIDSKLLMGSLTTSAASLLIGNPELAIGAFSAGAILELGKLSLEYAKQRQAIASVCHENPISYIAETKQQFEG